MPKPRRSVSPKHAVAAAAAAGRSANPSALTKYIDALVQRLRELVPDAAAGKSVEAVHQARVTTRRLKAALDLLEPVTSKSRRKPLAKTLKKLRRRLGPVRDLDVMLAHLEELQRRRPALAPAAEWFATKLRADREEAQCAAREQIAPAKVQDKLHDWAAVCAQVNGTRSNDTDGAAHEPTQSLLAGSLHEQLEDFARQADELSGEAANKADPHTLRIAGKSLRYTIEMAQASGHKLPKEVGRAFKRMQAALGTWHDYVVLCERAQCESADAMLAHHDASLQHGLLNLAGAALRTSERCLARFVVLWREYGQLIREAICKEFPLSRDVSVQSPDPSCAPQPETATPVARNGDESVHPPEAIDSAPS
jgi:CHAD domain-containing protein